MFRPLVFSIAWQFFYLRLCQDVKIHLQTFQFQKILPGDTSNPRTGGGDLFSDLYACGLASGLMHPGYIDPHVLRDAMN